MAIKSKDDINQQLRFGGSSDNSIETKLIQDIVDSFLHIEDGGGPGAVIRPSDFGAIGIGQDTEFLQAAIDLAIEVQGVLDLEGLRYVVSPIVAAYPVAGQPLAAWDAVPEIRGGGAILIPDQNYTEPLFSMKNAANRIITNLRVIGDAHVINSIDTTWDISPAPSQNNLYFKVEARGALGAQWLADGNNDSTFLECLIEGRLLYGGNGTALQIDAAGGLIKMAGSVIYGRIEINAQQIDIHGGVTSGWKITGLDDNVFTMHGGYHYESPETGINFEIDEDCFCYAINFIGSRIENSTQDGRVIGGTGNLMNSPLFNGCKVFRPVGGVATGIQLIDAGVTNQMAGEILAIQIINSRFSNIGLTETSKFLISVLSSNIDGFVRSDFKTGGKRGITLDGVRGTISLAADGWGNIAKLLTKVSNGLANGGTQTFTFDSDSSPFPIAGKLFIKARDSSGPVAEYSYSKRGSSAGIVTQIHRDPDTADGVTLTIPSGSALAFTIANGAAAGNQTYNLFWVGTNNY